MFMTVKTNALTSPANHGITDNKLLNMHIIPKILKILVRAWVFKVKTFLLVLPRATPLEQAFRKLYIIDMSKVPCATPDTGYYKLALESSRSI